MTAVALLSALMFLLLGSPAVFAQRFGSAGGGGRSGGSLAPSTGSAAQTSVAPLRAAVSPAPALRAGPSFQRNPVHPNWANAPAIRGPVLTGKPPAGLPLGSVWGSQLSWRDPPPYRHYRPYFHYHPGIVVYGVPAFVGTTTITQIAPGVLRQERRYVEDSSPEVAGRGPDSLAPFDPTPLEIVDRMLALAGTKKGDVVYDLGAGDGRILIAAAKKYSARAIGFETDPGLVKLARENARKAGVEKLVEIRQQDFLSADLSPATLVTLYLSYDGNLAVREQLRRQLRPGARVVSYTFDMGDWPAKIAEAYRDETGNAHSLYLWEIAAPALASRNSDSMLQPQPSREGPLIIEVR